VWTTLHDFGGTDGMKGDLARVNNLPFTGLPPLGNTTVMGTGMTPEGIDQNPAYYEFVMANNMRAAPVADITGNIVARSHRRYGLKQVVPEVVQAWSLLVNSTYAQDLSVQDSTGVPHFPGGSSQFEGDRFTPTPRLCLTWQAWGLMLQAAPSVDASLTTFRYDLVNLGRELLAQLSTPVSQNFSDAIKAKPTLDAQRISATGQLYIDLLADVDQLVATESAFLLGPYIAAARAWGSSSNDCVIGDASHPVACADFYDYNARTQLTTWIPTPEGADVKPDGPDDYASKHWSGLINDYYRARAIGFLDQALLDAASGTTLNTTATDKMMATLAYTFQNTWGANIYPTEPVGNYRDISIAMHEKWAPFYAACSS
jgi:alpha-N-acetylglucosaminidase